MLIRYVLFWVFLLSAVFLIAQNPYYINFDTKDGLPSSEVYDIEIGQNGLIWISTDRGVCTYDGYEFTTYTTQDGLADNTNFEIYKDSKNRLWFNGYSGRISFYENGNFHEYFGNDSLITLLKGHWVSDIIENREGDFYCTARQMEELFVIQLSDTTFPKKVEIKDLKKLDGYFKLADREAFKTDTEAIVFLNELKYYPLLGDNFIGKIAAKLDDDWIYFNKVGLSRSDNLGHEIAQLEMNTFIENIYIDDLSSIWLSTTKGMYFLENGDFNQSMIHYFGKFNITSCIKDSEGGFWISTAENGVLFVPSFDVRFFNSFRKNNERFLCLDTLYNHLCLGSSTSSLITIDREERCKEVETNSSEVGQITNLSKSKDSLVLPSNIIYEKGGEVFVEPSYNDSPICFTLKNGNIFRRSDPSFIVYEGGVKISSVHQNQLKTKITNIVQDEESVIWLSTLSGIIKIKDYQYNDWEEVLVNGENPFGRVKDIVPDHLNNRWIASIGNGVFYHTEEEVFQIRKAEGLNSDLVNKVFILNDSTVFVGTNQGLNIFNYHFENDSLITSNFKSFTTEDGLSSNYINDIRYWNDLIWLATNNGVCNFTMDFINSNSVHIPVFIEELIIDDSSYSISEKLVLNYDKNDLFINYTGISFKKEKGKSFYRYRLKTENNVPNWFFTNEKKIRYNDLPPDEYTFEVSARNKSGLWNETPAQLSFKIKPHFTDTLWFRILLALLAIGGLSFIAYLRIQAIKTREIEKRKLKEAELATLRNQMNPHFIFNAFNSIQNFIFKKDVEKANYYLSMFSKLMRDSLEYSRLDYISLEKELNFIKDYLELESMRFSNKFEFVLDIEESLDLDYLMIPSLLLQPVLENGIKHAFKDIEYKGILELSIREKNEDSLEIIIKDNGPGLLNNQIEKRKKKLGHKSYGLEIIQNRITLLREKKYKIQASVSIKDRSEINAEEKGLEVHFVLPIKYKE